MLEDYPRSTHERVEELLRVEIVCCLRDIADQASKDPDSFVRWEIVFYKHDWDFSELVSPARKLAEEFEES